MPNMSYCRFQNTLNDLRDCAAHFEDDDLSMEENLARARMLEVMAEMLEAAGLSIDVDQLEEAVENLRTA